MTVAQPGPVLVGGGDPVGTGAVMMFARRGVPVMVLER